MTEPDLADPLDAPLDRVHPAGAAKRACGRCSGSRCGSARCASGRSTSTGTGPARSSAEQHADALVLADVTARWVLDAQAGAPDGAVAEELETGADFHFAVHNAAGIVSVQEGISVTEALIRLRAFAYSHDRLLADVAQDVIAHTAPARMSRRWPAPRAGSAEEGGMGMTREADVVRSLVEMADTLVDDYDVVDLLTGLTDRCVSLLGVSAAGVMLASPGGRPRAGGLLQRGHAPAGTVRAPGGGRPLPGRLPHRRAGRAGEPAGWVRPLAAVLRGRRPGRFPVGVRAAAAPAGGDSRRAEPAQRHPHPDQARRTSSSPGPSPTSPPSASSSTGPATRPSA